RISDVSPLAGLRDLQTLIICNTRVEDISPLSGLFGLTHLDLNNNMIEDISPLAKLSNLEYLSLWNNKTRDLTPLSGLDRLMYLALSANRISDISPLASGKMGGVLIRVRLEGNSLSLEENSPAMAVFRKLNAGKVDVRYDPQRGYAYGVKVYVNSGPVSFPDQQPFIDVYFGRTYVPLRFVSEALGAKVDWEENSQKVTISKGEKIISLQIGSKEAVSNGEELFLDTVPLLVEGRTMVPLRFISEALGVEVNWTPDGEGGRVDVNY
ncbi:MAG: stalk domain-containing protein, partial [Eubacteriales bacterium]